MRKLQTHKPGSKPITPKPTDLYEVTDQFLVAPVDMDRLTAALREAEKQHTYTSKAFGGWESIPLRSLRGITGRDGSRASGEHASSNPSLFKDTAIMQPYIRELIDEITGGNNDVLKVRLMRLKSNRVIGEHRDRFSAGRSVVRLHIPVVTNPGVEFRVNRKPYHMDQGKLYCIDVSQLHAVSNKGDRDRVHLVFDVCLSKNINKKLTASINEKVTAAK